MSTFENGSSRRSKEGLDIRDLISDARWASPALISWGYFFKIVFKKNASMHSSKDNLIFFLVLLKHLLF